MELYNKLLKVGILRANPKIKQLFDRKKTVLDVDTQSLFENGVALGKYLLVLKEVLKKNNQDLNIDVQKMNTLKVQSNPPNRLFNWNLICDQLDKLGISIDTDTKSLIVAGEQEQIIKVFTRIERFIGKITGGQVLNFDGIKTDTAIGTGPHTLRSVNQSAGADDKTSNARRGNKPNQKKKVVKDGVDILTMNENRDPGECESTLELILNTLCKAFQMKPKQAAALLTNNNQFLIHSIVKGVKGKFEPVIAWYQDMYANSRNLTVMLELEIEQFPGSTNFQKVLATMGCGLYSSNIDICRWCSKLLTKIGYDFGQNQQLFEQAMKWFLEKEGGLELQLHALKKHPDLVEDFVAFISQFTSVNDQLDQVYRVELKKYFNSPLEYVNALNDLFPFIIQQQKTELLRSGVLDFWMDSCLKQGDNDGKYSYDERVAALTLLGEIWLQYTDHIDAKNDTANNILQVLKRGARDRHRPVRMVAVCQLFRLLDKLSPEKNASAPSIYKTLIFSLVENPSDTTVRELYLLNFASLYESSPSIPIGLLIDPLIKQIQVSENITFYFQISDLDFFSLLAKHPKLQVLFAIPLADMLAKVYLNDVSLASAAAVPFMQIISRFIGDEEVQEFLIKFETICLSMIMGLEKNAEELQLRHQQLIAAKEAGKTGQKRILALPAPPKMSEAYTNKKKKMTKEQREKFIKEKDEEVSRRLKKSHIIEISNKILNLRNDDINDQLRDMLLSTNKRFNELYGFFNKGLMSLLKWWGDAEQIMNSYVRAIEEKEQRIREEKERIERMEQEKIQREQEAKERKEIQEKEEREKKRQEEFKRKMQQMSQAELDTLGEDERRLMGYDSAGDNFREGTTQSQNLRQSMAVVPYTQSVRQLRNQKAIAQIDKIKRNKMEREEQKRLEEERKHVQSQRQKKKLRETLNKRKIELGILPAGVNEDVKALLYKDQQYEQIHKSDMKTLIPQIRLIDLDEEEERDKQAVVEFLKKYSKLWKNMFYKYANSGFSSKNISNFDQMGEKADMLNSAEMLKLLKDHGAYPQLISKEEIHQLFRLINIKNYNKNDLQALNFNGFQELIVQFAFFAFSRPPKDMSNFPPEQTIRCMLSHFENAIRSRGQSTVLFEDPDTVSVGDRDLIKAINDKLAQDPNYPIPEGYYKQTERIPSYQYIIPDSVKELLPESQSIGIEVLDELINEIFGIHFLEPIVTFEEKLKVKPVVKNLYKPQAEALNYMKKVEKKLKPVDSNLNPNASLSALEKLRYNQEIKPVLCTELKLEVANYPLKERPFMNEVAETLEEILAAASRGLEFLPQRLSRVPGQIYNEAKKKKEDDQQLMQETREQKEQKRKHRDAIVKTQIQSKVDERNTSLQQQRQEKEDKDKQEQERQKRGQDKKRKEIEDKRKQIDDSRNKQLEDALNKRQEDSELNREANERKKKDRAEFLKKQKDNMTSEFGQVKKEREELANMQEELKKKELENNRMIKDAMENFINDSKQERGKEQEERRGVDEFLKKPEVENIFALFEKSLQHMFKFYASQDKKEIGFDMERNMSTINFREFIRFGYQQNIVPVLLLPEDLVLIYRQLVRERIEELKQKIVDNYSGDNNFAQSLDFDYFKKSLIRIAVMAQDKLGGQAEDQLLEKMNKESQAKEDDQKRKDKLKKRNNDKSKADLEELKEEFKSTKKGIQELEISETTKQKEDAFFKEWMKKREDQGISLKKRIIGNEKSNTRKTSKKVRITIEEGGEEDLQDGGATMNTKLTPNTFGRKTKLAKDLKQLEDLTITRGQVANLKIEDKKVKKDFDVMVITSKTIEGLMRFLGIQPDDNTQTLNTKLNQNRIEIQGQKPTKIKIQLIGQEKLHPVHEGTMGATIHDLDRADEEAEAEAEEHESAE